jgi:hypothetical protein
MAIRSLHGLSANFTLTHPLFKPPRYGPVYLITQLKRARVPANEIIQIYCSCIRPLLEYASPVFHNSLPQYLNLDIERVQKRCIKRIFPGVSYEEGLKLAKLETLCDRRSEA